MKGSGVSGYTPTALASATGKWSSWAGDPKGVWIPFVIGSSDYNGALTQLTNICGGPGSVNPGMTTLGYQNQCNPPLAPFPGETGADWTIREQAYTKNQMTSTQAQQYQSNLDLVTKEQAIQPSIVNSPDLSTVIASQQPISLGENFGTWLLIGGIVVAGILIFKG